MSERRPTDDRDWVRLEELFAQACDLPADAAARFLDEACADEELRAELQAMLAAHRDPALSIERLVNDERLADAEGDSWLGKSLGPWRLTRVLGRGGMGLVYGAERADGQYQLEVAVKLMRSGPRDPHAGERFRTERQVLASLNHPHIAALVDGGFAPDRTPYLVMELVEGVPITEWCHEQGLSLHARLRLFRIVCDAVQHAHQALVVHRDLKPTNIFVSGAGEVKLLDFGIAKLLEPEAWGLAAAETRTELRVLTPEYAAPEQREGGPITTATDVYALGVVLYELIAGVRPSRLPRTLTPPSVAVRRGVTQPGPDGEPRRLARLIRGDLDRIVLTALREESDRRYVSAGQLAEEIDRFLEGRPVLAQPDRLSYRLHKFVRRNRLAVAGAAVFLLSLVTFGAVSAWQARVLAEQRRVAQVERDTSEQVVRVLVDLFEGTNPAVRPDGDRLPVGEFLAGAQARSLAQLQDVPAVQAKLQQVFGLIHHTRGQYGPARAALEQALAQQRRLVGPDHPSTLESLQALGEVCQYGGDHEQARELLEDSLTRHRRVHGEGDVRTARALFALASAVRGQDQERAGTLLRQALEIRQAQLGPRHPEVAEVLAALGAYHWGRNDWGQARGFYRRALDVFPRPEDRRNPVAITLLGDFAGILDQLDAHGEAEALQREAIDLAREVLGSETMTVANLLNNLAISRAQLGRHADAEAAFREAFATHEALLGPRHWRTRNVARNVGRALELQGRYGEALAWMDRANTSTPSGDASEEASLWGIRAQRAQVLFRLGRRKEALAAARAAVRALTDLPEQATARPLASSRVLLGRMLVEAGRASEAAPVLEAALASLAPLGPKHPRHAEASCELARAQLTQGAGPEGRQRLGECLPVYAAWGLAEHATVDALERLRGQPSP